MVIMNRNILTVSIPENPYIRENNININQQQTHSLKEQEMANNANIPDIKYKTELCRTWIEQNFCPYMEKCRFAHGKTDLHDKIIFGKNYKQKDCKSFHTKGYCPYGPRCLFRHDERKFTELNRPFYKFILEDNFIKNVFKNLNKKRLTEEEFINSIEISDLIPNFSKSPDNDIPCYSPSGKKFYYTPHLKIFTKIRQRDSFSFDSTDVDIDFENSEYANNNNNTNSGNTNCSLNNTNIYSNNNTNQSSQNLSPKVYKNFMGVNCLKKNTNNSNNNPINSFMNLEKSAENIQGIMNNNNVNNKINPNCQKNFPIFNNCNKNVMNSFSVNFKNNAHITNNNINNFIINTTNANFHNKNLNKITANTGHVNTHAHNTFFKNSNNNNLNNHNNVNTKKNNNNCNNAFAINNNNNEIMVEKNAKNTGSIDDANASVFNQPGFLHPLNKNGLSLTSYTQKGSNKANNLKCWNLNTNSNVNSNNNNNIDVSTDYSPEKNSNILDTSSLSNEINYCINAKDESFLNTYVGELDNNNSTSNFKQFAPNQAKAKKQEMVNKEIIFENFNKISKNTSIKNSQKNVTKIFEGHQQDDMDFYDNPKQGSFSCTNIDELTNFSNCKTNSNSTNITNQGKIFDKNRTNSSNKENEKINFFNNNQTSLNFYSIY